MAKTDVASLAVKLSGSAEEFNKMITGAERRLTGFANTITSPLNALRGLGGGIGDLVGKPIGSLVTDMTRFTSLIPGLGALSATFAHPIEAAEKAMQRLDKLGEDASRMGVGTQFLRGLQIGAEEEAGSIASVMPRLLKFQAQLRTGSEDLLQPGGSSAFKKAKELQLNIAAWKAANPEQLFFLYADGVQEAAKSGTEFAFATDIGGKNAAKFMNTLMNADAVRMYTRLIREAGVATKENVAIAEAWDDVQKRVLIRTEAAQEKMIASGGLISKGFGRFGALEIGEGISDITEGALNMARRWTGNTQFATREMADEAFARADELVSKSMKPGERTSPLMSKIWQIKMAVEDQPNMRMTMTQFGEIAEIAKQAKDLIPKSPAQNLELAAEKALILRDNLKAVTDTSLHMGKVFEDRRMELLTKGRGLTESLLTPAEKMRKEMEEAEKLDLTDETRRRLLERTRKNLMGAQPEAGPTEANVALSGSQEWAKRFSASIGQAVEKDKDALAEAKRATGLLDEINRKLGNEERPRPLMAPAGP